VKIWADVIHAITPAQRAKRTTTSLWSKAKLPGCGICLAVGIGIALHLIFTIIVITGDILSEFLMIAKPHLETINYVVSLIEVLLLFQLLHLAMESVWLPRKAIKRRARA